MLLCACREGASRVAAPNSSTRLVVLHGDYMTGDPGVEGAQPLVVAVRDAAGNPAAGTPIERSATAGGIIRAESPVTDSSGIARAWWTLGDPGAGQLASASTVWERAAFHGWVRRSPAIPLGKLVPLQMTTFDGSGQVVHPDVTFLPNGWEHGSARLAMAITPYPYGDPRQENPSIFVSESGADWAVPTGEKNPVQWPQPGGFLSDPALVFEHTADELRLYYREVIGGDNVVRLVTTTDGVQWSMPRETVRVPLYGLISPTVVRRSATRWLMWSVDGGRWGCSNEDAKVDLRRSEDGVHWDAPTRVVLNQPGGYPWHIDVKWIESFHEYWALYNLKLNGMCATPAVYLATSPDGVEWKTYRNPVLQRGAIPEFADVVYRSSFEYTKADDMVTFYFSGARWDGAGYVWRGALQRRSRAELFADLERATTTPLRRPRIGLPSPERFVGGSVREY